jgi:hypothetical protein
MTTQENCEFIKKCISLLIVEIPRTKEYLAYRLCLIETFKMKTESIYSDLIIARKSATTP